MLEQAENLPKWNLDDFYLSIDAPDVSADIEKLEILANDFSKKYSGRVASLSGDEFAEAITVYEQITELSGKLSSYAYLNFSVGMNDAAVTTFFQNISEKINDIYTCLLFFTLDINKVDESILKEKLSSAKLQKYSSWIRDVRVMKPDQLSDEVEKVLHEKYVSGKQAWVRLFDETLTGLKFRVDGRQLSSNEVFESCFQTRMKRLGRRRQNPSAKCWVAI